MKKPVSDQIDLFKGAFLALHVKLNLKGNMRVRVTCGLKFGRKTTATAKAVFKFYKILKSSMCKDKV